LHKYQRHHKRRVDLGLAFRLSGVPNNASLELKKLDEPRKEADVILVLQLDDGSRLPQITFKQDAYLNDILNAFKNAPDR
jgi:tether containing UBX domain for GLUT4